jgi:hypothetical protein
MAAQTPQISPDGAYWWDGQAWRPMPMPNATVPAAAPSPQTSRPSWLPEGVLVPGEPAPSPVMPTSSVGTVADSAEYATYGAPINGTSSPPWMPHAPPSSTSRTTVMVAAITALVLMAGGVGLWVFHQSNSQNDVASSGNPAVTATASPATSASATQAAALPLTAQLGGDYCPVAHPGDAACWKGSLVNTGPRIGKLALIFVVGAPYSNWFANHANAALSGFNTSPGCDLDAANSRIVCGPVGSGQEVDVYLGGDVTTRGTFNYAVKFADISSGSPVYVNQHPDGTHDVVSWREAVS